MRGWRLRLARTGLLLIGAILGGGILEAILAASDTVLLESSPLRGYHEYDPTLGWVGTPGHVARFRGGEFDIVIANSERGFRRSEVSFEGTSDAPKVVFFGDSFTWGWGVKQGEVFTDQLQDLDHVGRRIMNRGVNAYGTAQQRHLLDRVLAEDDPDRVVIMFFGNDPEECVNDRGGKRPVFELQRGELIAQNVPVRKKITGPFRELSKRSIVLSYLRSKLNQLTLDARDEPRNWFHESQAGLLHEGWDVCRALLLDMRDTCAEHGVEFQIVFIPLAFEVTTDQQQKLALREQLEILCTDEGISWLDLTPSLHAAWAEAKGHTREGLPFYYPRDQHWTASGHEFAAKQIQEWWNE